MSDLSDDDTALRSRGYQLEMLEASLGGNVILAVYSDCAREFMPADNS